MNKRRVGLAATIGLGVTAFIGVPAVTAQEDGGGAPSVATQGPGVVTYSAGTDGQRTAPGDSDLEFVALGAGCRIFDTRGASGPLSSGIARNYSVTDAAIASQGGASGGCGVPDSAVAVSLSVSTLANTPTGTGFVRIGQGDSTPTATVLQFLRDQGISVTTNVPLSTSQEVRVRVQGASAGMVGDVLGYYERPLHATVDPDGDLVVGSGVERIEANLGNTVFTIDFERDISDCTPSVSATADGPVIVQPDIVDPVNEPQQLFVRAIDSSGDLAQPNLVDVVLEC